MMQVSTAAALFADLKHVLRKSESQLSDLRATLSFVDGKRSTVDVSSPVRRQKKKAGTSPSQDMLSFPPLHQGKRSPGGSEPEGQGRRRQTRDEHQVGTSETEKQQLRYAFLTLAQIEGSIERAAVCLANGTAAR
jgi:hypothetical protein